MLTRALAPLAALLIVLLVVSGAACSSSSPSDPAAETPQSSPSSPGEVLRDPADPAFSESAPERFRVRLETSEGNIVVGVYREWAPLGADRFYQLVKQRYYDDTRFFRVRESDFAQFGIHGDPEIARIWRQQAIDDDPVRESNSRGRVGYAHGFEPHDRTTQIFIALKAKLELDDQDFAPFGEVLEGMEVADSLYSGYGETAGGGIRGGKQDPMFEGGNAHFDENFPELDRILRATILPWPEGPPEGP